MFFVFFEKIGGGDESEKDGSSTFSVQVDLGLKRSKSERREEGESEDDLSERCS